MSCSCMVYINNIENGSISLCNRMHKLLSKGWLCPQACFARWGTMIKSLLVTRTVNSLPALWPLSPSAVFSADEDVRSRRQAEAASRWCRRPPMTRILDRLTIQQVSGPFKALNILRKKRNCISTAEQPAAPLRKPVFFACFLKVWNNIHGNNS